MVSSDASSSHHLLLRKELNCWSWVILIINGVCLVWDGGNFWDCCTTVIFGLRILRIKELLFIHIRYRSYNKIFPWFLLPFSPSLTLWLITMSYFGILGHIQSESYFHSSYCLMLCYIQGNIINVSAANWWWYAFFHHLPISLFASTWLVSINLRSWPCKLRLHVIFVRSILVTLWNRHEHGILFLLSCIDTLQRFPVYNKPLLFGIRSLQCLDCLCACAWN